MAQKDRYHRPRQHRCRSRGRCVTIEHVKNVILVSLAFLCLSRACLGKCSCLIRKCEKKKHKVVAPFSPVACHFAGGLCGQHAPRCVHAAAAVGRAAERQALLALRAVGVIQAAGGGVGKRLQHDDVALVRPLRENGTLLLSAFSMFCPEPVLVK